MYICDISEVQKYVPKNDSLFIFSFLSIHTHLLFTIPSAPFPSSLFYSPCLFLSTVILPSILVVLANTPSRTNLLNRLR